MSVYQLNPNTVSPARSAGRDKDGIPREETLCALAKWSWQVDADGNVYQGPLQSGRTLSHEPEAERYEQIQLKDHVEAGGLFLEECPHTSRYQHWVGQANEGRLVPLAAGETACNGTKVPADHPAGVEWMGCEHMTKTIKARRLRSRQKWEAQQTESVLLQQAKAMGEGIANALANPAAAGRNALREGKGEK